MNASPSLLHPTESNAVQVQAPPPSFLSIPYHHPAVVGTVTNPGLVSPTDSHQHPNRGKDVLASPNIASHSVPFLLQTTISTASTVPDSTPSKGGEQKQQPTPIVPRPSGSALLPPVAPTTVTAAAVGDHLHRGSGCPVRLNKFVRRLHDMLVVEKDGGVVEWRRGLLVIFSTDVFTKNILPKYFNTRNFKTFRRQLNYYGFVHVRSFSATGSSTTALWINQELAQNEANDDVAAVLKLRRVEPNETAKTVEGRRQRKELALHTVEEDIGLDAKKLQLDQIRSMAIRGEDGGHAAASQLILSACEVVKEKTIQNDIPKVVHIRCDNPKQSRHHVSTNMTNPVENSTAAANMLLMLARS